MLVYDRAGVPDRARDLTAGLHCPICGDEIPGKGEWRSPAFAVFFKGASTTAIQKPIRRSPQLKRIPPYKKLTVSPVLSS